MEVSILENFINSIIPGNYAITKSMEFSKVSSAGTLWYLKKFFVYYYYIFFKDDLYDNDYDEITEIFNEFIKSLSDEVKAEACSYFFDRKCLNLQEFLNTNGYNFSNAREKEQFILRAKKAYFVSLMNLGGQSGYKAKFRSILEDGKSYLEATDIIKQEMLAAGENDFAIRELLNDYPAPLRNERQIFFYYGLFHGQQQDVEGFHRMTAVGKAIIKANFHELLLIWEHQKLKRISQSPITEIKNLKNETNVNVDCFKINKSPYLTLLNFLKYFEKCSIKDYQFVISRLKGDNVSEVLEEIKKAGIDEVISQSISKVQSFNRRIDKETEDFSKELKKYILGLVSLPKDNNSNYYACLKKENSEWLVDNSSKFELIYTTYQKIANYLNSKHKNLYDDFENELKRNYEYRLENGDRMDEFKANEDVIYNWHNYIINFDFNIVITLIYLGICLKKGYFDYKISDFAEHYSDYKDFLYGIKKNQFVDIMQEVQLKLANQEIYIYADAEQTYDIERIDKTYTINELENCIEKESQQTSKAIINRKRNTKLIKLMKAFYTYKFASESTKLVKCDCCSKETFMTYNAAPYLEFHHIIPFGENGPDHMLNLIGICPECHRKLHFADLSLREKLYVLLSNNNNPQKTIKDRIVNLYKENRLEPINLDFLKKERIITKEQYKQLLNNDSNI